MSARLGCFARRAAWSAAAGSAWWTQRAGGSTRADAGPWQDYEAPVTERLAPAVAAARLARQARDRRFDGYVEPEVLAGWLAAGRTGLAVVDVRDSDFRAARTGRRKIRGAWHAPACELRNDAAPLVEALRGADTVVFHCMFSQQRGPACAQAYAQHRRKVTPPLPAQHVLVLRDGFAGFQERFGANAEELFEGVGPRNSSSCLKQGRQFVPAPPPQPS